MLKILQIYPTNQFLPLAGGSLAISPPDAQFPSDRILQQLKILHIKWFPRCFTLRFSISVRSYPTVAEDPTHQVVPLLFRRRMLNILQLPTASDQLRSRYDRATQWIFEGPSLITFVLWNKIFLFVCLIATFIDPVFFFLHSIQKDNMCVILDQNLRTILTVLRSITDLFYLLNIAYKIRISQTYPDSGQSVDGWRIPIHYKKKWLVLDVLLLFPLPQLMTNYFLPKYVGGLESKSGNLFSGLTLIQYLPRILRVLPLIAGFYGYGQLFISPWVTVVIHILLFLLASHAIGSFWFLFGLERIIHCLEQACKSSGISHCKNLLDCPSGDQTRMFKAYPYRRDWLANTNASSCLAIENSTFGIYSRVAGLSAIPELSTRYLYSLFWGLQQMCTVAGNLVPTYDTKEIIFSTCTIWFSVFLLSVVILNLQSLVEALGQSRLRRQVLVHDINSWMKKNKVPSNLRREIRQSERRIWANTDGINMEGIRQILPQELRDILLSHFPDLATGEAAPESQEAEAAPESAPQVNPQAISQHHK